MPLSGLKVLDLCRARSGPSAVRQLADWGADVIKIELPAASAGDTLVKSRDGFDFQNLHRNKRGMTINMSRTQEHIDRATPELGEHTDEVLSELGYDAEGIAKLHDDGVV